MGAKENLVQNDILSFLESLSGCVCWRNNQIPVPGRRFVGLPGVSDILCCFKGAFIAIECKSKNGVATEEQLKFLGRINRVGGIGLVAYSKDDVINEFVKRGFLRRA